MDDIMLWQLLVQGNQHVLEVLYKRYYSSLINYGLKYCSDIELVKDSVQDVFIKLYVGKRISDSVLPVAYLLRSVKNSIFTKLVSLKDEEELGEESFYIPESMELFEQLFSRSDEDLKLGKSLLEAISQLSTNQKNVLYLRYVKELSYKEIADMLGINVQSSMNLANRALVRLRILMGKEQFSLLAGMLMLNSLTNS